MAPRLPALFFPFLLYLYCLPLISTIHVQIQINSADTCPINPSLKFLGVVVKAKKYSSVSCRAFNVIVVAFSQIFPCLPLSCSLLIPIIFHGMVRSVALNGRPFPLSSAWPGRGGVLPRTGPLAQHIHRYGLPGLSPTHHIINILYTPI